MIEFFETLRKISGLKGKIAYARENHTPELDMMVEDALNPDIAYGITSKDLEIQPTTGSYGFNQYAMIHDMLQKLAARQLTGNEAKTAVESLFAKLEVGLRDTAIAILDRALNIGIGWKVWRSEVLGIREKFEVALAITLGKAAGVNPIDGTYYASRKCDGCRLIAIVDVDAGTVEFRSRQNKRFTTLENLAPAVLRFCRPLSGIWVLDGELCKVDAEGNEDFQAIMKEIRRKDYSIADCCYQVFDLLPYSDFCAGESGTILSKRFAWLNDLNDAYSKQPLERCHVKPLRQECVRSQADFDKWGIYAAACEWEGFMLRRNVPYRSGRTKDLLKVKKFYDAEYVVDSIEFGKITTTLPGQGTVEYEGVTNLIIMHKGNPVGVGSGLTREQRIDWMRSPSHIIGKTITVKYFEETTAQDGKKSLRFPTLKYVYDGGRDA